MNKRFVFEASAGEAPTEVETKEAPKPNPEEEKRNEARGNSIVWKKDAQSWLDRHPENTDNKTERDALLQSQKDLADELALSYGSEQDLVKAREQLNKARLHGTPAEIQAAEAEKESCQQLVDLRVANLRDVHIPAVKAALAAAEAKEPDPGVFKDPAEERDKRNAVRVEANVWRKDADAWLAAHPESTVKDKQARADLVAARDEVVPQKDPSYAAELDLADAVQKGSPDVFKCLQVAKDRAEDLKTKIATLKQAQQDAENAEK